MPIKEIVYAKRSKEEHAKRNKEFAQELAFHKRSKNELIDNVKVESDDKVNAIEYFNSLNDGEKEIFKQELEKKKVRNSYVRYLKYVYGDNFKLTKFHLFLAKLAQNIVERIEKHEKVKVLISTPPQHGKGYPVDFPILTTKGWKKHGDLRIGDYVYNDKGEQVMVIGTQTPYYHQCLKVNFASGESHIVTREHLWKVFVEKDNRIIIGNKKIHHNIRVESVLETQEIKNMKHRRNPYILMNSALKNDYRELPINPYILGLWLGDGTSSNNEITVSDKDLPETLNAIGDKEHYVIFKRKGNPSITYVALGNKIDRKGRKSFINDFRKKLHDMGLKNNKHIPIEYLLSSEEQRWELLRGLMDTDGSVCKDGRCEFCNVNETLAKDVLVLLRSLGVKANINVNDAKLYGRFISKRYRIAFSASSGEKYFNLPRKQYRVDHKTKKDRKDKYEHFITSIEETNDQLVSCISVEGDIYLAGYGLIPTHNSSVFTETLPSWFLGRNPDLRCIVTGYNADIAEKFGDRNRQKIKNIGKDLFGIEVSDSQDNKTLWDIKDHMGGLFATGINGSLTSNAGALIIIDDPIKNEIEANNPQIREAIWANYTTSILTRQRGEGNAIIVIQTRWHEDDLIGRIIEHDEKNEWIKVNIPCVWEEGYDKILHRKVGETLCPELGFDVDWADTIRKTLGARRWNALYQGKPFVDGGDILKRDMIKTYSKTSCPSVFEEITLSCDLSFGETKRENDPVGIGVWGRVGGNHYLLEYLSKKMSFTETLERLRFYCGKYPTIKAKIIEKKANGNAAIEVLNNEIGGFIPYDPKMNSKETRLQLCLPFFEAGNVYYPDESVDKNFEEQIQILLKFPKVAHDEIVDITTQYLLNYQYKYGGRINTNSSYTIFSEAFRGLKI